MQAIYLLINKAVDSVNKSRSLENKIQLAQYKFQIVPLKDPAGEQVFWINAFCDDKIVNWRNELYAFNGKEAGDCFFNLKVNAAATAYHDFAFDSHE